MSTANQRSALAALDAARPTISRLDQSRDPEDIAADLLEGWSGTETALRALMGGSTLSGQALIRELRQRDLISLDSAHALLEFQAARDRAGRTEYRPTSTDIAAARNALGVLDTELMSAPAGPAAGVASAPIAQALGEPASRMAASRGPGMAILLTVAGAVMLAAVLWFFLGRSGGALDRGVSLYASGRREAARGEFTKASRDDPESAAPHIYLGRIAREEGDMATAARELQSAVKLEPSSAVAQREMGAFLLATGSTELARRFYVRAVQLAPGDRNAQGFLGCALLRLGRVDEGRRFMSRAGEGSWSSCQAPAPAPPPRTR